MRSLLFVPGDSARKLDKALHAGADAIIVDLEDSVAMAAKAEARRIAADFTGQHRDRISIYVRVNGLSTGMTAGDLAAIMPAAPHGIMLPKAEGPQSAEQLSVMLRAEEALAGLADGITRILPIITETAAGLLMAPLWRTRQPRLAGLTWGAEDLSADVGATSSRDDEGHLTDPFRLARSLTLFAAAACETDAIDTVHVAFNDLAALDAECRQARRDGFSGKLAIHPAQVPVINAAFTPSDAALAEARAVVNAFAEAGDAGVVAIDGRMFDRPHLRRAERVLRQARPDR